VCVCRFGKGEELRDHIESKHKEGGVKCGECFVRLGTPKELVVHQAAVHGEELPYKCPVCGLGKRSTGALSNHIKYTWMRLNPPPRLLIQISNNCKDLEHFKMNKNEAYVLSLVTTS